MLSKKIEQEKAFILDTIRSMPLSRIDVVNSLLRERHIERSVLSDIGEYCRDISRPALDFIANLPGPVQRKILDQVKLQGGSVHVAITAVTREIISDDAVYSADLMKLWKEATPNAREMFLASIQEHPGE